MKMLESGFTECARCNVLLTPAHAVRIVAIPDNQGYLAVVLKCTACGARTKIVAEAALWEESKKYHSAKISSYKEMLQEWKALVAAIEIPEDLYEIWSKNPPLREAVKGACTCASCHKRWFTK